MSSRGALEAESGISDTGGVTYSLRLALGELALCFCLRDFTSDSVACLEIPLTLPRVHFRYLKLRKLIDISSSKLKKKKALL